MFWKPIAVIIMTPLPCNPTNPPPPSNSIAHFPIEDFPWEIIPNARGWIFQRQIVFDDSVNLGFKQTWCLELFIDVFEKKFRFWHSFSVNYLWCISTVSTHVRMKFVSDCCGLTRLFIGDSVCTRRNAKLGKNLNMLRKTHCAMNTLYLDILKKVSHFLMPPKRLNFRKWHSVNFSELNWRVEKHHGKNSGTETKTAEALQVFRSINSIFITDWLLHC